MPSPLPKPVRPSPVVAVMPILFSSSPKIFERLVLIPGICFLSLGSRHSIVMESLVIFSSVRSFADADLIPEKLGECGVISSLDTVINRIFVAFLEHLVLKALRGLYLYQAVP